MISSPSYIEQAIGRQIISHNVGFPISVRQKEENDNDQRNTFFESGVYT